MEEICLACSVHSVSHKLICLNSSTCCHTEIEVAVPTSYVNHPQDTDTRKTGPTTIVVCWSQQYASVSQGRIYPDNCTCCRTETEVADQTFYLTQSQYTDTGPTSPNADPITPGAWQGSHWSADFQVTGMIRPGKIPTAQAGFEPRICRS